MSRYSGLGRAAKRVWSRLMAFARRLSDLWPWTPLGMALALVAVVSLFGFGVARLDLVLLVLGYGSAAVLALSSFAVCLSAAFLKLWLRKKRFHWSQPLLETERSTATGFWLPSMRWVPLVQVSSDWTAPLPSAVDDRVERGRRREYVTLARRGRFERVRRRVVVQDVFGLVRIGLRHEQPASFEVWPHPGAMRRLPVMTSLTAGEHLPHPLGVEDGDRVELRRYVAGDPARFIHWKVFGRTRKLMVRMPERALSRARRTAAYLVAGRGDEAAAAAARVAVESDGFGIDWQFAADGSPEPCADPGTAMSKIIGSADFDGGSASGLHGFLSEVDAKGPAALVLFAAPVFGPWLDELRAATQRRSSQVRVVLVVDAIHEDPSASRFRRWLLAPGPRFGSSRAELERVSAVLKKLRCEVVMIDRVSGRIFGDASAMIRVSQRRAA